MNERSVVVIFPYAGGSKDSFNKWNFDGVERLTLDYHTLNEAVAKAEDVRELSVALADYLAEALEGAKFSVLAYSFGSIIGYATVRRLIEEYGLCPEKFVTVACVSPDRFPPSYISFRREDLRRQVEEMGFFGERKMRENIFQQFILPAVAADFRLAETYRYNPGEALPVNIYAFMSDGDSFVRREDVEGWRDFTSGKFEMRNMGQGHFSYLKGEGKGFLTDFVDEKIHG